MYKLKRPTLNVPPNVLPRKKRDKLFHAKIVHDVKMSFDFNDFVDLMRQDSVYILYIHSKINLSCVPSI